MENFKEAGLPQPLFHRLEQIGFDTPTPIQAQAIPAAMLGNDILGTAQTGTGKTGAYGIPLVTKLLESTKGSALILLPTRELAQQVMQALKLFIGKSKIPTALLIGGESMPKQIGQLKMRPRLIVGTPGRINDHLDRGTLMLHDTSFLVLDEVDRMLDMGFGVQLDAIARFLTGKRQTLMFSATLPKKIEKVAAKYLTDPVRISVGAADSPAAKVKQVDVKIQDSEKYDYLLEEIAARPEGSIIIFVKTKYGADKMSVKLRKSGLKSESLHGDLRQSKRARVTKDFRDQKFNILVATDVAARGLDIPHIEHVINYDLPQCPEDYIHRIGRTARAGAEGEALNFVSPRDAGKWREIQLLLDPDAEPDPMPKSKSKKKKPGKGRKMAKRRSESGKNNSGNKGKRQNSPKSGRDKKEGKSTTPKKNRRKKPAFRNKAKKAV